jgi:hypothetical protein
MAAKIKTESRAQAVRRLTEEMLDLEQSIDKQPTGPKRLELLRAQAALSDKREALMSTRV